jgi:lycopene cyclase domain-containing protein
VIALVLLSLAVFNIERLYTSVTFTLAASLLLLSAWKKPAFMGRFYLAYLVCLLPFALVNGVLTSLPVVWYDNTRNLGFRLGSIPVEDTIYNLLLLLGVIWIYERGKRGLQSNDISGKQA